MSAGQSAGQVFPAGHFSALVNQVPHFARQRLCLVGTVQGQSFQIAALPVGPCVLHGNQRAAQLAVSVLYRIKLALVGGWHGAASLAVV